MERDKSQVEDGDTQEEQKGRVDVSMDKRKREGREVRVQGLTPTGRS